VHPDSDTPDAELWASTADGSTTAFALLFDRHAAAVYNHCFRLTGSWAVAEDLTSTVFLQAWRRRAEVRITDGGVRPWLLAVAGNSARTERRSLARRLRLAARVGPQPVAADHADDVAERVDDERRMAAVLAATGRLPRAEREALQLCVWGEVPYAEAAEVLGVAVGSVRARVSRGRSRLARLLAEPEPTPGAGDPLTSEESR
jgi:RNA polymerase sigma-70 factor (ECF subfamily)